MTIIEGIEIPEGRDRGLLALIERHEEIERETETTLLTRFDEEKSVLHLHLEGKKKKKKISTVTEAHITESGIPYAIRSFVISENILERIGAIVLGEERFYMHTIFQDEFAKSVQITSGAINASSSPLTNWLDWFERRSSTDIAVISYSTAGVEVKQAVLQLKSVDMLGKYYSRSRISGRLYTLDSTKPGSIQQEADGCVDFLFPSGIQMSVPAQITLESYEEEWDLLRQPSPYWQRELTANPLIK